MQLTYFLAANISLARETLATCASHGASWKSVIHSAFGIRSTWLGDLTRVFAVSAEASQLAGTVNVSLAARIRRRWD